MAAVWKPDMYACFAAWASVAPCSPPRPRAAPSALAKPPVETRATSAGNPASAGVRWLVNRLATGPAMIVSDFERRIGARYTLDMVRALKARFAGVRFVWIMGADGLANFHAWRGWAQLMREVPVAVIARPGVTTESRLAPAARRFAAARLASNAGRTLSRRADPAWIWLNGPLHTASSTALRDGLNDAT